MKPRIPPKPPRLWPGFWIDISLMISGFVLLGYDLFVMHLDASAGNELSLFVVSIFTAVMVRDCIRNVRRLLRYRRDWRELRDLWEQAYQLTEAMKQREHDK